MRALPKSESGPPEIWGGLECTLNRVGDQYIDQFELTGHYRRPDDLDRVAALGIKTLRYPVLWERVYRDGPHRPDWSFADERLARIRSLGMTPVVGLLHHGSGPRHAGLADPAFPNLLADYAAQVARRHPWIDKVTPVNEPLTTARFCGLYGHWHPHGRDAATFLRCLLNQCRGTALAMRAMRAVNPAIRLVQTEDLAKVHATGPLVYQAAFENHRRWLSLDLLCGRVGPQHPLWDWLLKAGATEADFAWFRENPCPPDILGFNYYVTSERFLDHRLELYPSRFHGGNGRDTYADLEAVRACDPAGLGRLLREAWERYRIPMALTEVQAAGLREDQMAWFLEAWETAVALRKESVEVDAVTAWSLFGACDWNTLVTAVRGFYEPGAFDIRGHRPRPTALARLISDCARGVASAGRECLTPGWWHHPQRLVVETPYPVRHAAPGPARRARPAPRPLLVTGNTGTLGTAFRKASESRHLPCFSTTRREMDITDARAVRGLLEGVNPWAVVNAAGYVRVDEAERDEVRCRRENTVGPAVLAEACARLDIPLLTFSTDLVFDGSKARPYLESDPPAPLNVYGRTKAEGENAVLTRHPRALVVRTSAFLGPWDGGNFVARVLETLRRGEPFVVPSDQTVSPTWVPDLALACLDLLQDKEAGLWHLANQGAITWAGLASRAARAAGLDESLIVEVPGPLPGQEAARPRYSVLGSERGWLLPTLEDALERCFAALVSCSPTPVPSR